MKILFVARRAWPAVGGVEAFMRHVSRELGQRHDLRVLALRIDNGPITRLSDGLFPPPPFAPFEDGPVRVEPLRLSAPRRALMSPLITHVVPGLRRYAYGRLRIPATSLYAHVVAPVIAREAEGADVIHAWAGDFVAAAAVRAAQLLDAPSVVMAAIHPGQWGDDRTSARTYRAATRVIALLESEAVTYRRLGVGKERIGICGACSPGVMRGGGVGLRARLGIEGPLVLFVGERRPYKGIDLLLEAAPLVAAERPDVIFAFVGPGSTLGVPTGANVLDVGRVSEGERGAWLEAADLLCLPSAGESFGIVVLEAWSAETPVVVSEAPALLELVRKSRGGVSVAREPQAIADALLDLLASPNRLAAMGGAGHSYWRNNYTVAAVSRWHEQLYRSLLEERARTTPGHTRGAAESDQVEATT